MKTEILSELVWLCRRGNCSMTLEVCTTGIVANVKANRQDIAVEKAIWIDANEVDAGKMLENAVSRINQVS